ncbi:MAG: YybS family protein [Proteobacteria bacterium]|nr:YybS family protein [Pseudomonadota bacterium]MBU1688066.1 YybS family protein [Pseudomonadota bacterium]
MADSGGSIFSGRMIDPHGFFISLAVLGLPVVTPEFIWLQLLTPLLIFFYFHGKREEKGTNTLSAALGICGIGALLQGELPTFFFSVTMIPVGIALAHSASKNYSPGKSGSYALAALLGSVCFWLIIAELVFHVSLYQQLQTSIIVGLKSAGDVLLQSNDLPAEQKAEVAASFEMLQELIPMILPGLLFTTMLNTVFLNMVAGQALFRRKKLALPWSPVKTWRLPDQLVGLVIFAGICLLIPLPATKAWGQNLMLIVASLYFFQGLAVVTGFFFRWKIPMPIRILTIALLLLQAYGVMIIAIVGLADVWADFGSIKSAPTKNNDG